MKNKGALCKLSIIEAHHHTFAYGATHALADFLKEKSRKFAFIEHPFRHFKHCSSTMTLYGDGKLKLKRKAPPILGPESLLFLKDTIVTLLFVIRLKTKFHIYIGADCLNALAGLFLRRLGFVRIVIFYVIDYTPYRFTNPIKNCVYQIMDRICARSSDYVWSLSHRMTKVWKRQDVAEERNLVVPQGCNFKGAKRLPLESIDRKKIVFIGHLVPSKGIQLIIEALPEIADKVPDVKLIIIGTGPYKETLEKIIREKSMDGLVKFLGYIPEYGKVLDIVSRCGIGLAPYVSEPTNISFYADPAKPKEYLACGLPVIITQVPEVAFKIEENKAGIAINYNKKELVDAAVRLLMDDKLFEDYRSNAIKFASKYDWETIFQGAFTKILRGL